MKKFLFLSAIPLLLVGQIFLALFISEETRGFERYTTTSVYEYCDYLGFSMDSSRDLEKCATESSRWESSRYKDFIKSVERKAYPDTENLKGDTGGCDFDALQSIYYLNAEVDVNKRLVHLRTCQDVSSIELYNSFNDKKFKSKGEVQSRYRVSLITPFWLEAQEELDNCREYEEDLEYYRISKKTACQFFISDYAIKLATSYGNTPKEILQNIEYDKVSYAVFSPLIFVLTFSPILLIGFLIYKFKSHLIPSRGENITEWLNSQKKFRLSLLSSFLWALLFFLLLVVVGVDDAVGLTIILLIAFYPLLLFISIKFITSAKD